MFLNFVHKKDKTTLNEINSIALPLMLSNVTGLIIGLTDQAMVGRISLDAYGAVGLIGSTFYTIAGVLGMIAVGFNILGGKEYGGDNEDGFKDLFSISIYISIITGLTFFIVMLLFSSPILKFLYGLHGQILNDAISYSKIFSLYIGLTMITFTFSSYLKIKNKTKYVFYSNTAASISNIILDYILIFGKLGFPEMGVTGAAIASILALIIQVLICAAAVYYDRPLKMRNSLLKKHFSQLFKTSLPLMGQEIVDSSLFIIGINAMLSRIGVLAVSVYNLIFSITNIVLMPMYAYSSSSLTVISKANGSYNINQLKDTPIYCTVMSMLFGAIIAFTAILFKNYVPKLITDDRSLIAASSSYITIGILSNIFNYPATVYKYSLQGINDERWTFISSSIISFISLGIIFLFSISAKMGLHGIYLGFFIYYLILTITFLIRYLHITNKYEENEEVIRN